METPPTDYGTEIREHNDRLIDAAENQDRQFLYFLLGWMRNKHHNEMATAARSWLDTYDKDLLAKVDAERIAARHPVGEVGR